MGLLRRLWHVGLAKFLGNFNDNAFKTVVIMVVVGADPDRNRAFAITALASMVFMLPFIALPTVAGWMADRFQKRRTLIALKLAELAVMVLGALGFWLAPHLGYGPLLLAMMLMAAQATCFSPAYLGLLPELFDERDLSRANGLSELLAYLGIILGLGAGGVLVELLRGHPALLGLPFLAVGVAGVAVATFIPPSATPATTARFRLDSFLHYFSEMRYVGQTRAILQAALGYSLFATIGFLLTTALFNFGKYEHFGDPWHWGQHLHLMDLAAGQSGMLSETGISALQLAAAIGIGLGCAVAGAFSGPRVEFGLVPVGAVGMAVFAFHLSLTYTVHWALMNLFLLGLCGGFFVLPLTVYLQEAPPMAIRGKTLAAVNALSNWMAFGGTLLLLALTGGLRDGGADGSLWAQVRGHLLTLDSRHLFVGLLFALILMALYVVFRLPENLLRMLAGLLTRFIYTVRVLYPERLPRHGPVLLLANHVSLLDGLLLTAATSRPLYFLAPEAMTRKWWMRPVLRWTKLIPLPPPGHPKALAAALEQTHALLRRGEVLCIFPEGRLTNNGAMGEFKRGFATMLPADLEVPIIPVHLGLLWGSIFSHRFGRVRIRRPRRLPYPVNIAFGLPLPRTVTPFAARQAVSELDAASESASAPLETTLGQRFIRMCRRRPLARPWADGSGQELSNLAMLARVHALAARLRRDCPGEQHIGLLLPTSTAGAAMAMACWLADKVPVFLNYTTSRENVDVAIARCQIKHLYTSRVFVEKAKLPVRAEYIYLEDLAASLGRADKLLALLRAVCVPAWLAARWYFPVSAKTVHHPATVLFSSGSAGLPKGVMISHHNLIANLNGVARILGAEASDVLLGSLPFFHSFGFLANLCLPMCWGLRVVYHPNPTDAAAIGELVEREKITFMLATPTFLQTYTRRCTPEQFKTLRLVITGAEKLRADIAEKFIARFGVVPIEGYGTTELSPVVSVNVPANLADIGRAVGRPGSVGIPLPGIAVRLTDPFTGALCDEEQEGVLQVKGPNVMLGYLAEPERTAEVLTDGWYHTGDMAKVDREGYLYITGRLSRFSKIGGEMVPHLVIEEAIHAVLNSQHETLAVVSAVEDEERGERLLVLHLPWTHTPHEVTKALRAHGLANLWIPKERDFHQIPAIPLLGSGKLDLCALKALAKQCATQAG